MKLKERIRLLENVRKITTSHTPSSQVIDRPNSKGLRIKSDKPTGGQIGHEGNTLLCREIPDEIISYIPIYCKSCGLNISDITSIAEDSRQEVIIPPIRPQYVAHVSHSKI